MIKNRIIASVVGGIILFLWQFLSYAILGIHREDSQYLPQQDRIMQVLNETISKEGTYLLPNLPPEANQQQQEQLMQEMEGKPFATITYVPAYQTGMARPMIRGFLLDIFLVYLLIYIFSRAGTPNFIRILAASISAGIFTWLWGPYTNHVWYQVPWSTIRPLLIDAVIAWGLCGLWLGWYFNRKKTNAPAVE